MSQQPDKCVIQRIAAFCDDNAGGNPAGVVVSSNHPPESIMQRIAADVGYSETVFASPYLDGWRVRYFSPTAEVPFCGHATIALGAALALKGRRQIHRLFLTGTTITVESHRHGDLVEAALQSPPTRSSSADSQVLSKVLSLFGLASQDLDARMPPAVAEAGARHLILPLASRAALACMHYDFAEGRALMVEAGFATIALTYAQTPTIFHARNAFAFGGVYEDPATGAAAAALAGYLRDIGWPHTGKIQIIQGEDMGMRSILRAEFSEVVGSSVRVIGTARTMRV